MPDREKIIKGLQIERECVSRDCDRDCGKCDLVQDRDWLLSVYDDALALLKEQDEKTQSAKPVKPRYNERTNWYECGVCRYSMTSGMHCRSELIPTYKVGFCAKCGKAVKWNDI